VSVNPFLCELESLGSVLSRIKLGVLNGQWFFLGLMLVGDIFVVVGITW
jgi:hypothetical protein